MNHAECEKVDRRRSGTGADPGAGPFHNGLCAVDGTGFSDVSTNDWYAEAVMYCHENELMSGTGSNAFSPNTTMTRAMLATVLWRLADEPVVNYLMQFSDVAGNDWYTKAVRWAASEQIMGGYGNGLFGTNDPVSREQISAILWRYEGSPEGGQSAGFADGDAIDSYAVDAVDWARANGIMNGRTDNIFAPQDGATRAEVATILMNYTRREQPAPTPDPEPDPTPTPDSTARILVAYFSATNLHSLTNGATWLDGRRFSGGTSRDAMIEWGNSLGLALPPAA